jgi:hypothetical protein
MLLCRINEVVISVDIALYIYSVPSSFYKREGVAQMHSVPCAELDTPVVVAVIHAQAFMQFGDYAILAILRMNVELVPVERQGVKVRIHFYPSGEYLTDVRTDGRPSLRRRRSERQALASARACVGEIRGFVASRHANSPTCTVDRKHHRTLAILKNIHAAAKLSPTVIDQAMPVTPQ